MWGGREGREEGERKGVVVWVCVCVCAGSGYHDAKIAETYSPTKIFEKLGMMRAT